MAQGPASETASLKPASPASFAAKQQTTAFRARRERRRSLLRNLRHGLLGLALVGAILLAVRALRPRPVPVDVVRPRRGALVVAIEESGITRVKDRYVVSAPTTGRVSRIALEAGDIVREGDALAEIAPSLSPLLDERTRAEAEARLGAALSALGQARSQVSRAEVAAQLAEQEFARNSWLARVGSVTQQTLEQAEFTVRMRAEERSSAEFASKVAAEEVRIARVALGRDIPNPGRDRHVDVLAPASGWVLRVHHKSAGVVQAGTPIVEVGDARALEVLVDLLTTDAVHVKAGTPVVIQGWGGDGQLAGKVRRTEPSAFTRPSALGVDEQRVNVVVTLTDPPDRWSALGDGYRVEARMVLWRGEDVLTLPQGAVFRHGDGWAVFRVDSGTAQLTPIRIGHRSETEVEVLSGGSLDFAVAVHPGDRVRDGAKVEAR